MHIKTGFVILASVVLATAACSKSKAPTPGMGTTDAGKTTQTEAERAAAEKQLDETIEVAFKTVYFDFDRATLTPAARDHLTELAKAIKANPGVKIQIEGHTDENGSNEYNLALGERRAAVIKEFLVAEGVEPNRLMTMSAGEEKPAVEGSSEEAWAKNRRGIFAKVK